MKKTVFMQWIDVQLEANPRLAREVDELVNEMKLEQELVALREKRGLSQRQLAKLLGTSQPYVAKLESGRIKNVGVRTLVKCARALGGSVMIESSRASVGLVARGCGRRGSRRGESYAERTWALSALSSLSGAGRANEAYAAELARRTDSLNQESLAQVLVALHRGGETSGRTVEGLVNEVWGGLVVRLYQGREVYGGLQSRASARNTLILPSETRTLSEMTRALVRTDGDDPRIQLLVDALVTLGRGDGWGSTNANASALLALTDVVKPPFEGVAPSASGRSSAPSAS